jgi:hypothetical protein
MTEHDRMAFARALYALGETFNEPVSELRAEGYFDALSDFELPIVLIAMRSAMRESRFFPRPIELREFVEGSADDRAELAWTTLQRLVQSVGYYGTPTFPDEAMRRAALELYGGWQRLCASLPADGPELLGYRKTFIATYRAYANRTRRDLELPPTSPARYLES